MAFARHVDGLGILLVSFMALASVAHADQVRVKGEMLEGEVSKASTDGLVFTSEYGSGDIVIPWADIESLETDNRLIVLHGEDAISKGHIQSVENGDSIVLQSERGTETIAVADLFESFSEADWSDSTLERLRAKYRHWSASLAASGSVTQSRNNSQSLQVDLGISREKGPTHYMFEGTYFIADSEDEIDDDRDQSAKRAFLQLRGEYDFSKRGYVFGAQSFEWDKVNDIKTRLIPRAGAGYRFIERDWGYVSGEMAPSFFYETQNDTCGPAACNSAAVAPPAETHQTKKNSYVALSIGARSEAELPLGSKLTTSLEYFPDVVNWSAYLLRAKTVLNVPIIEWLSLRISLEDTLNSDPPDDGRRNRFTGAIGLSIDF